MNSLIFPISAFILFGYVSVSTAYENEDAVPLTIEASAGDQTFDSVLVELNGRDVSILTSMRNESKTTKQLGFTAYTPFFEYLGKGEEHYDKSFSDLAVLLNSKKVKITSSHRGFFMGRDITNDLVKARIAPLPHSDFNEASLSKLPKQFGLPIKNWQGYVAYSWSLSLPAQSINRLQLTYRALPQFGLEDISDESFANHVMQHCGNPDEIRKNIKAYSPDMSYALVERYDLPIKLKKVSEIRLKVSPPNTHWLRARPLISLACGIKGDSRSKADLNGPIQGVDNPISVLVISKLADLAK